MSKKQTVSCILIILLLLFTVACGSPAETPVDHLSLGERFLLEMNYEQALVHFLALIDIEPMNPRGYTGAAEAHIGLGQVDEAIAVLRLGQERLPDNVEIRDMLDGLVSVEAEQESELMQEYDEELEDVYEPDAYMPVWELFSDEQRDLLTRLEIAAMEFDYEAAHAIINSAEFKRIFDEFSDLFEQLHENSQVSLVYRHDATGFWSLSVVQEHKAWAWWDGNETGIGVSTEIWRSEGWVRRGVGIEHWEGDGLEYVSYYPSIQFVHSIGTRISDQFHGTTTVRNLVTGESYVRQVP